MRALAAMVPWVVLVACFGCETPGTPVSGIATIVPRTTHRASSHDPTGGNRDSVGSFAPGTSCTLLDTDGPGCVTHIWMTVGIFPNHTTWLRDLIVRMYWERSSVPSVEVPLGHFFALAHCKRYAVQSAAIAVGSNLSALNCYWPMPFHRHARIEIHNAGRRTIRWLFYQVDYERGPIAADQGLFHAAYHRRKQLRSQAWEGNTTGADNYVILDTVGEGQYVGCVLAIDAAPGGWWGEGDDMIFVDDAERPTMLGTGSEDYFCNAWGFQTPFCYPYYGAPLLEKQADGRTLTTVYRWHIPDPVRFRKRIRVTIEHIFNGSAENDYASVAYWYQRHPVRRRDPLPPAAEDYPRHLPVTTRPASYDLDGTELEPELLARGVMARGISATLHEGYKDGGWLRIEAPSRSVDVPVPVPAAGTYAISLKPVNHLVEGSVRIRLAGGEARTYEKRPGREHDVPRIDLGRADATDGRVLIRLEGNAVFGIDYLRIEAVRP